MGVAGQSKKGYLDDMSITPILLSMALTSCVYASIMRPI